MARLADAVNARVACPGRDAPGPRAPGGFHGAGGPRRRPMPRAARRVHDRPPQLHRASRGNRVDRASRERGLPTQMTTLRDLELYLVRHAVAAERGGDWPDDTARPLTPDGAAKFRKCVS